MRSHLVDGSRLHDTDDVIRPLPLADAVLPGKPMPLQGGGRRGFVTEIGVVRYQTSRQSITLTFTILNEVRA